MWRAFVIVAFVCTACGSDEVSQAITIDGTIRQGQIGVLAPGEDRTPSEHDGALFVQSPNDPPKGFETCAEQGTYYRVYFDASTSFEPPKVNEAAGFPQTARGSDIEVSGRLTKRGEKEECALLAETIAIDLLPPLTPTPGP